jgi:hypothetical protein
MTDIRIVEENEVYWATTKEYTLVIDGETVECRIEESTDCVKFFEWTSQAGWEEGNVDSGIVKVIYDAWCDGELVTKI